MFEKEAEEYVNKDTWLFETARQDAKYHFQQGAEFGYNKAKEEIQAQDYSLGDFAIKYENGKYKCKDKSGKEFESVDGKTWKEIVLSEKKGE